MKELDKKQLKETDGGSFIAIAGAAVSFGVGVASGALIAAAVVVGTYYLVKALT